MVRKPACIALLLVTSLASSASVASASDRSVTKPAPRRASVLTVNTQLNGQLAALFFVGNQVFDRFNLIRDVVGVGKIPTPGSEFQVQGTEGPDGCDPIGVRGGTVRNEGPPTAPANNHLP